MPMTKEKGVWPVALYRLTSDKPREPQEGDLIWPVSSDSKVFVAMVWVWSEDQWVRSKKGISSSLATPTNVVDCVPGGHFLHFVGTGNNRSWPRSFSCYLTSWNGILLMIHKRRRRGCVPRELFFFYSKFWLHEQHNNITVLCKERLLSSQ